jgi:hypothetical protein
LIGAEESSSSEGRLKAGLKGNLEFRRTAIVDDPLAQQRMQMNLFTEVHPQSPCLPIYHVVRRFGTIRLISVEFGSKGGFIRSVLDCMKCIHGGWVERSASLWLQSMLDNLLADHRQVCYGVWVSLLLYLIWRRRGCEYARR